MPVYIRKSKLNFIKIPSRFQADFTILQHFSVFFDIPLYMDFSHEKPKINFLKIYHWFWHDFIVYSQVPICHTSPECLAYFCRRSNLANFGRTCRAFICSHRHKYRYIHNNPHKAELQAKKGGITPPYSIALTSDSYTQ